MAALLSWLYSLTTDYYSFFALILCAMVVSRWILQCSFRNIILKSQAVNYIDMLSETEFAEISKTTIQTQTENLTWMPSENVLASSENNKMKMKRINDELMQIEQHLNELNSHAHCFQKTNARQQNDIFSSEISKCELIKLELELQKKELLSWKGHGDQLDLQQNNLYSLSREKKQLINMPETKKRLQEDILEREQNNLLVNIQQFSNVLEKIIPELENFQFKLRKLNEADTKFFLHGENQPVDIKNSYIGHCRKKPQEKEEIPCNCENWKQTLSKIDTNFADSTDSAVNPANCCLKHIREEKKIALEIKQEKAKAERELQLSLCKRDRNKWNYEKAKCMMMRAESALILYYQYFNQAQEALHLREGTCRQFSDTIVKKGYETLKEQCNRSQQLTAQLDKDLTVHYEEAMAVHNVLEILEKHAVNFFERQELLHSQGVYIVNKIILLHELIEYVERDEQRLCYFLREVNESKKKMAAMVKAVDNIEGQAKSLKNNDSERVKAELMKVVKQMQYAKCLDSNRALKDSELLLSCMNEKIILKPSQLDQLRLKGEIESILKKCQDWSQREKTLYIEQIAELQKLTASQCNLSEQSVDIVTDTCQKVSSVPGKVERKETINKSLTNIEVHSDSEQKIVSAMYNGNGKSISDEAVH